jgi:hypothetical protein
MFELIEVDPATGDEDQLMTTGTFGQCSRRMADLIQDFIDCEDWDLYDQTWPVYRVQPATEG